MGKQETEKSYSLSLEIIEMETPKYEKLEKNCHTEKIAILQFIFWPKALCSQTGETRREHKNNRPVTDRT